MGFGANEGKRQLRGVGTKQDDHAYKSLFYQFYNPLLLYGFTIAGRRQLVEDQIQDLFIWLYRHPEHYRGVRCMEAYLFTALKRKVLTAMKQENRLRERQLNYHRCQESEALSVEDRWVSNDGEEEKKNRLQHEIARLPPRMREVIYLRYYRCLGYEEIAGIMEVSTQVARNFASRALKKVRHSLPYLEWASIVALILTEIAF